MRAVLSRIFRIPTDQARFFQRKLDVMPRMAFIYLVGAVLLFWTPTGWLAWYFLL